MSLDIVDELPEKVSAGVAGRPGNYYSFNKEKYFKLKEAGANFEVLIS
jgi:hypothetical protein